MTIGLKSAALAACIAVAVPAAANALTIFLNPGASNVIQPGVNYTGSINLLGGSFGGFGLTAGAPLTIGNFSISGSGNSGGADVGTTTFSSSVGSGSLGNIVVGTGGSASGTATVDGPFEFAEGDDFGFSFDTSGAQEGVSVTLSFSTGDVAPVPLPAAGGLLALGLLGMGAAARRRKA